MAVYNGSQYIYEQVASILPQLGGEDEIVAVDDASQDASVAIIEGFHDKRIHIVRQERNHGVISTFGRALQESKGEIIFLSDQDDVWRGDKVERCLQVFREHPGVTLVMSDLVNIDAAGRITSEPRSKTRRFHAGLFHNLVRNHYQGSAMAFRRSILEYCLPFPADIPMHDWWIGLVNQFVGNAEFIEEPLLFYRRHGGNESPENHALIGKMLRWRWPLVKDISWLYIYKVILTRHGIRCRGTSAGC
jgi:glycosyltransferase involved in cell wall biosynthesis